MKLGIFASGNGSNLQAIMDAIELSYLKNVEIAVIISNNNKSNALKRASKNNIPSFYINNRLIDIEGLKVLQEHNVDLIVLAGVVPSNKGHDILDVYKGRVINIHPTLLPKYGGKGMYGIKIHERVIKSEDKETGVTIHWVDEEYDTGFVIKQVRIPI